MDEVETEVLGKGDFWGSMEDVGEEDEVTHLTRSGRHFKATFLEGDHPGREGEIERGGPSREEEDDEDHVLKQLKKTQANISIWGLLLALRRHRQAFLEALAKKEVPMETMPEQVLALMGANSGSNVILTFSQKDLPTEGLAHSKPLYVTAELMGKKVPVVLVNNGSALNVCPMHTATKLGITENKLTPSALTIRAYDSGCRSVLGTFKTTRMVGPVESVIEFCVMDINTSYNLLLGRTWLHPLEAVPSTVHQKIKLPWKEGVLVIHGDGEIVVPVCELKEVGAETTWRGFEVIQVVERVDRRDKERISSNFGEGIGYMVAHLMKKMNFLPGIGFGKYNQGVTEFPDFKSQNHRFGIGSKGEDAEMPINRKTLNGNFVKEGEDFPYCGFLESWYDWLTGRVMPGLEVFFKEELKVNIEIDKPAQKETGD